MYLLLTWEEVDRALDSTSSVVIVTVQILTSLGFITFGLVSLCIYFRCIQHPAPHIPHRRLLQLLPFLLTLSIIACGGVFRGDASTNKLVPWAMTVVWTLLLLHIPISGLAIWRSKGQRGFVTSLATFQLWLSLCSSFVSSMSIQDAWL